MILAEQLLAVLEQKQLLPGPLIQGLRKQLAQSEGKVPAATLAKRLVEKGHLSAAQAKQVLESLTAHSPVTGVGADSVDKDSGLAPLEPVDLFGSSPAAKPSPAHAQTKATPSGAAQDASPGAHPQPMARKVETQHQATGPSKAQSLAARGEESQLVAPSDDDDVYGLADEPAAPTPAASTSAPTASASPTSASAVESAPSFPGADALLAAAAMDAATSAGAARPGQRTVPKKTTGNKKVVGGARPVKRGKSSSRRTSLIVGLVGAALVIGGALWILTRPDGNAELQAADAAFQSASYASAVEKYTSFLRSFPRHENAGRAKVRLGISQLHEAMAGQPRWPESLKVAQQVLADISSQFKFPQSQEELAAMLPQIAAGLAASLSSKPDPQSLQHARQSWDLVRRYVPKTLRNPVQAAEIETTLALTQRQLTRPADLEKALAAMQQSTAGGNTSEAYAVRATLLADYAELASHSSLRKAQAEISQAEKATVRWTAQPKPAATKETPGAVTATTVLWRSEVPGKADGVAGQVIPVAVQGAVYALDATTGRLLWRRLVGFEPAASGTGYVPLATSAEPGADWILIDWTQSAILCIEALSGRLRWFHPLDERPYRPALAGKRLVVPTASGRLLLLDVASGQCQGFVQLPQSVTVSPAVDGNLIFQPAQQNSLYVLTLEGQCKQVVSLGHESHSISAPPAIAGRTLLVAVNDGLEHATIEVLSIGHDEKLPLRPIQQISASGRVDCLITSGATAVLASDLGHVRVMDLSESQAGKPPVMLAEVAPSGPAGMIRYGCLGNGHWWLADTHLARYAIAGQGPAKAELLSDSGGVCVQPPRLIGNTLFHVWQPDRAAGVWIAAVDATQGKKLWETVVGAPLAAAMSGAQDQTLTAVGGDGGVWRVALGAWKTDQVATPVAAIAPGALRDPLTSAVACDSKGVACSARDQLFLLDAADKPTVKALPLGDELGGPPTPFAGGLLLPLRLGQVLLLDAQGGKQAEAFQAGLTPGRNWSWLVSPVGEQVLLSDGHSRLYLVGLKPKPKPHLAAMAQVNLDSGLVSPLAVAGEVGYAVEASGQLRAFPLPTLMHGKSWPLAGRCTWGPVAVGNRVLLTAGGKLLCMDGQQNLVWQADLTEGPLAGTPAAVEGGYVLASASGVVSRVEATTGKSLAKVDTARPLAAGPLVVGQSLVLVGHDGSLYQVKQP